MEPVVQRCAGIDIGKANVKATVRVQGGADRKTRREVRTFDTTTPALLRLRDWLVDKQVTLVGMESTGVFWKPVYYPLEEVVGCWLLNAQHLKKVPGRKTDVTDSEWIAELVAHGRVPASFVPPPSTADRQGPSAGRPQQRPSTSTYARLRKPLLRGPLEPKHFTALHRIVDLAVGEARGLNHRWVGRDLILLALLHPDSPGHVRSILEGLGCRSNLSGRRSPTPSVTRLGTAGAWSNSSRHPGPHRAGAALAGAAGR
jgi:transposase